MHPPHQANRTPVDRHGEAGASQPRPLLGLEGFFAGLGLLGFCLFGWGVNWSSPRLTGALEGRCATRVDVGERRDGGDLGCVSASCIVRFGV